MGACASTSNRAVIVDNQTRNLDTNNNESVNNHNNDSFSSNFSQRSTIITHNPSSRSIIDRISFFTHRSTFDGQRGSEIENPTRYVNHPEAVIIACYFNPTNSLYRKNHFLKFYESIKHCNHRIIECIIGEDTSNYLLPLNDPYIKHIHTNILLWHKECLLNILIKDLDPLFKYVFWLDGDIQFTNMHWIVHSVQKLKKQCTILQPFEYAFHLDKDEITPSSSSLDQKESLIQNGSKTMRPRESRRVWKSYGANYEQSKYFDSLDYDIHGHVGFAWGIRRSILMESDGLYDKALIGGGDHIMAHAITSKIAYEDDPCNMISDLHICITKTHIVKDELMNIVNWSYRFQKLCNSQLGYVNGDVYHHWHGDLSDRNYFHRIRDFSPYLRFINDKVNGLYYTDNPQILNYINNYFETREFIDTNNNNNNKNNHTTEPIDGGVCSSNSRSNSGSSSSSSSSTNQGSTSQMNQQPLQKNSSSSSSYPHHGYYYNEEEDPRLGTSTTTTAAGAARGGGVAIAGMTSGETERKACAVPVTTHQTSSTAPPAAAITDISQKLSQHKKKVEGAFYYMDSDRHDDDDDGMKRRAEATSATNKNNRSSSNNNYTGRVRNAMAATSVTGGNGFYYSDFDGNEGDHHQQQMQLLHQDINNNNNSNNNSNNMGSTDQLDSRSIADGNMLNVVGGEANNISTRAYVNSFRVLGSKGPENDISSHDNNQLFRQSAVGFAHNRDSLMSSNDSTSFSNRDGTMFRQSAVGFAHNRDSLMSSNDSTSFNNNESFNGYDNYGGKTNLLFGSGGGGSNSFYSNDTHTDTENTNNGKDRRNSFDDSHSSNNSNSNNSNIHNSNSIKKNTDDDYNNIIDTAVLIKDCPSYTSPKSSPLGKLNSNNPNTTNNRSLVFDDGMTDNSSSQSGGTPQRISYGSSKFGLLSTVTEEPAVLRASQSSDCTGNESEQ